MNLKNKIMINENDILEDFYKAFNFCEKNRIRVYPKVRGKKFILVSAIDGVAKTSGKEYSKSEYQTLIKEYYIYLWKKFRNE